SPATASSSPLLPDASTSFAPSAPSASAQPRPNAPDAPVISATLSLTSNSDSGWRSVSEIIRNSLSMKVLVRRALRLAPLPLVGRGWGWGCHLLTRRRTSYPPSPALPHKGGGSERQCLVHERLTAPSRTGTAASDRSPRRRAARSPRRPASATGTRRTCS